MSSRNTFTSNYIYNPDVAESLYEKLSLIGWSVELSENKSRVTGMVKNVDYFSNSLYDKINEILKSVSDEYDLTYVLTLCFIGDEHNVITLLSSQKNTYVFNEQQPYQI